MFEPYGLAVVRLGGERQEADGAIRRLRRLPQIPRTTKNRAAAEGQEARDHAGVAARPVEGRLDFASEGTGGTDRRTGSAGVSPPSRGPLNRNDFGRPLDNYELWIKTSFVLTLDFAS